MLPQTSPAKDLADHGRDAGRWWRKSPDARAAWWTPSCCRLRAGGHGDGGLYETSGDWLYDIGLPGKSGIGGGIVTVSPGKGGLGTFAPAARPGRQQRRGQLAARFLSEAAGAQPVRLEAGARCIVSLDLAIVLALLVAAVVMFALGKPRMDAVALLMLALLPLTGVITMNEALAGFSDANVVLIALLFVIGEGLVRTGVAQRLGDWLVAKAGSSETRLLVLLMVVVGGLGSVMSSTGVVAIFIPIVLRIAQNTDTAPSRLMMPLSVAALISGMMTLVATAPNLVVDAELRRTAPRASSSSASRRSALPILVLGIALHAVRQALACRQARHAGRQSTGRPRLRDWVEEYGLAGRERRVRVEPGSPLAGGRSRSCDCATTRAPTSWRSSATAGSRPRSSGRRRPPACAAGDVLLIDLFDRRCQCRAHWRASWARAAAAERGLLRRPGAGGGHGRGHAARGLERDRPDGGARRSSAPATT